MFKVVLCIEVNSSLNWREERKEGKNGRRKQIDVKGIGFIGNKCTYTVRISDDKRNDDAKSDTSCSEMEL